MRDRFLAGLLETDRDWDLWRGEGDLLTLVGREGTDCTGVPVFDPAGEDFTSDVGNGIEVMPWFESEPLLSPSLFGLLVCFLSEELSLPCPEEFESPDCERLFEFLPSSTERDRLGLLPSLSLPSSDVDVESPSLRLLARLFRRDFDDEEELRDELLDDDFFLLLSADFSDCDELSLFAGEGDLLVTGDADLLVGDV